MPRLDFYSDYKLFVKFKLGVDEITIGRGDSCTVQLPDDRVSRVHAVIRPAAGGYELEDRSLNGTRVNDRMVKESELLEPGDRIYIQDFVFIYQPNDAPSVDLGAQHTLYGS